jgi:hypothetical protein
MSSVTGDWSKRSGDTGVSGIPLVLTSTPALLGF